jgi:fatty acid desaturase
LAVFAFTGQWPLVLLITLAPFTGTWITQILALAQHYGKQSDCKDFRQSTRTVILNPLLSFLYWNMNYHIEHHMYPGVPCYRLAKLHGRITFDATAEPTQGFISLLTEIIRIKSRLKKTEGFDRD